MLVKEQELQRKLKTLIFYSMLMINKKNYLRYFYIDVDTLKKYKNANYNTFNISIVYLNDIKDKIKTVLGINKSLKLMEDILDGIVSDKVGLTIDIT